LESTEKRRPENWHRSVFNGFAQVIVQSDKTGGKIKLSARANGLQQGEITILTKADAGYSAVVQK
jgi:hypothetical protein